MGSGENNVILNISGDSNGLKSALAQAREALKAVSVAIQDVSDVAQRNGASTTAMGEQYKMLAEALSPLLGALTDFRAQALGADESLTVVDQSLVEATALMAQTREQLVLLNDYTRIFSATQAEQAAQWLADADGAEQYTIRLNYLREQMALANAQAREGGGAGGGFLSALFGNISGGVGSFMGGGGFSGLLGGLAEGLGPLAGPIGMVGGALDSVTNSIGGFIQQSTAMFASLVGWQIFNDVSSQVSGFADQMFQLNNLIQKNQMSWKYLFGGGDQGQMISTKLMDWTKTASLTMPYTRQDLMQSITGMLSLPGMNANQIETYLPMLSALGASRAPGMTLQGITNAIQGAEFGLTRQLRYDLHINPDELVKYGLKGTQRGGMGLTITDPSTLLPALMKYSQAHGYYKSPTDNAGVDIADNTWWGAMSSWTDRIQNFQLEAGQSMFQGMQKDLVGISQWWDQHQNDLYKFADLIGRLAGGVVTAGGGLLGAFFTTLGQLGGPGGLAGILDNMDTFLEKLNAGDTSVAPWWMQLLMDGANSVPSDATATASHLTGAGPITSRKARFSQTPGGRATHTNAGPLTAAHNDAVAQVSGFQALGANLAKFGADVGKVFSTIGGALHTFFKPFLDAVGPQAGLAFASLGKSFSSMWKSSQPFLDLLMTGLSTLMGVLGLLLGAMLDVAAFLASGLAKAFDVANRIMSPIFKSWTDDLKVINGLFSGFGQWVAGMSAKPAQGGVPRGGIPGRASGGPVDNTGWVLVGEEGPELVYLPGGSYVYAHGHEPGRDLTGYAGGGGGRAGGYSDGCVINLNIYGNGDSYLGQVTRQAVSDALAQQRMTTNTPGGFRTFGAVGAR